MPSQLAAVGEAFSTRLRNAVDFTCHRDLETVFATTVEPSIATVLLKGEA